MRGRSRSERRKDMDNVTKFGACGIAVALLSISSTVLTMCGLTNIAIGFDIAAGVTLILMMVNAVKFLRR